jgi:hypothetical protein
MKYGIGSPFNAFQDDAAVPGGSLGTAASSSGTAAAVVEPPRKNRGARHRDVSGMLPNQQIKKKIKSATEKDDLDTQVLAEDGVTVLSVSKYLGHANRFDCSRDYRQDQDTNKIPRDLYYKQPRVPNIAGNGPFKRVHAEPDFRTHGEPLEFETDEV